MAMLVHQRVTYSNLGRKNSNNHQNMIKDGGFIVALLT